MTPGVIFDADFSVQEVGAAVLPSRLSFSRSGVRAVADYFNNRVILGLATDVAGISRTLAGYAGLRFEPTRTNIIQDSRAIDAATWNAGSAAVTFPDDSAGPDGLVKADRTTTNTNAKFSRFWLLGSQTNKFAYSFWKRAVSGSYGAGVVISAIAATTESGALSTNWTRVSGVTNIANSNVQLGPLNSSSNGNAGVSIVSDMHQIEVGRYTTSYIDTSGGTGTRNGERLYVSTGSSIVNSGAIGIYIRLTVPCAATSTVTDGYLSDSTAVRLWTDANDATTYVEMGTASAGLTISVGGVLNTCASGAFVFVAEDIVEIFVQCGGSVASKVSWRKNGGATTKPTVSGSVLGTIAPSGAIELLCNGTTQQFGGCVHQVSFYNKGTYPAWAA